MRRISSWAWRSRSMAARWCGSAERAAAIGCKAGAEHLDRCAAAVRPNGGKRIADVTRHPAFPKPSVRRRRSRLPVPTRELRTDDRYARRLSGWQTADQLQLAKAANSSGAGAVEQRLYPRLAVLAENLDGPRASRRLCGPARDRCREQPKLWLTRPRGARTRCFAFIKAHPSRSRLVTMDAQRLAGEWGFEALAA